MPVSNVAAAAWLSSALVVTAAAGAGIYQLANPAASTSPSSKPSSPTLGGGNVAPGNNGGGNGNTGGTTTGSTTGGTAGTSTGTTTGGATNNGNGNGTSGGTGSNPGHPITLTGAVTGLIRPGSPATLNVTISNPNNQDIVVTSVTGNITSVTTGTRPGIAACNAGWFHVGTFTGSMTIAQNHSGVVSIPVSLDNLAMNQDNCKGVNVQFSFAAQARQA